MTSDSQFGLFRDSVILKSGDKIDGSSGMESPSRGAEAVTIPSSVNGERRSGKREDHWGFLYSISEKDIHYDPLMSGKKSREREVKWLKMLDSWDHWIEHKAAKLKDRVRKGIPSSVRGRAWLYLTGGHELLRDNPGLFDDLVSRPDSDVVLNVIDKDLDRTFPSHVLFAKEGSQGQEDLRRVLKAYAMYNEKTGYCQAMAPVAATLLMHMTAEESFWCLVQICEQYLPGYYSPGLHAFQIDALILKDLLRKYLPEVKAFMDSKLPPNPDDTQRGLDPMLYCTEWFMSIFTRSLPWPTVLRVWDMFFYEGVKVLFKVALALLALTFGTPHGKKDCPGFFELTRKLRTLPIEVTREDKLVPEILRFKLRGRELHQEHISQADLHFTHERVRQMELQARRLKARTSFSVASDLSEVI